MKELPLAAAMQQLDAIASREAEENGYRLLVGKRVIKHSKKPFKSKLVINTVKAADFIHPTTGRLCYTFLEDDSYVECCRCKEVKQ